jgi:hypothetical protein
MEAQVSKGFLLFAQNTDSVNYVEQAYALALSIQNSQSDIKSVSLITNCKVPKKYSKVFDQIIPIPWYTDTQVNGLAAEHRWKFYYATPYEETIVLDTDMLMLDDISTWWKYCENFDVKFCSRVKNYKLETIYQDKFHRKTFISNKLTNPYFALHYFKKNQAAYEFYKVLEFVCNNWEWCWDRFASDNYQKWLSMDLAAAVAIEITGRHEYVIDNVSPLEFVHMKPLIQNWTPTPSSWQDTVPYIYNTRGELVVGNIKQDKLFHYVEKNFLTKRLLARLENLASGS